MAVENNVRLISTEDNLLDLRIDPVNDNLAADTLKDILPYSYAFKS